MIRAVYGIVEAERFHDPASVWLPIYDNPETSLIVIFFFIALAMEYIALVIFLFSGLSIPRNEAEA